MRPMDEEMGQGNKDKPIIDDDDLVTSSVDACNPVEVVCSGSE